MNAIMLAVVTLCLALQPEASRDYTTELPTVVDRQTTVRAAIGEADVVAVVELRERRFATEPSEFSGLPNVFDTIYADSSTRIIDVVTGPVVAGDEIHVRTIGGRRVGGKLQPHERDPLVPGQRYLMFLKVDSEAATPVPLYRPVHEMLSIYGVENGRVRVLRAGRLSAQLQGKDVASLVDALKMSDPNE